MPTRYDNFNDALFSMKLRLPNKLIAAIMAGAAPVLFQTLSTATLGAAAVAAAGQTAQADYLDNAVLGIDSFSSSSIDELKKAGWVFTNLSGSEEGDTFTSGSTAAVIKPTDITTTPLATNVWGDGANRFTWSGIVTISKESLKTAILLQGGASSGIGLGTKVTGTGDSAAYQVTGTWNADNPYDGMSVSFSPDMVDNGDGTVTLGVVFRGGNGGGTTVYVGEEASDLKTGLKWSTNTTQITLSGTSGVEYHNLYWFKSALTDADMAWAIQEAGSDKVYTWNGTSTASAWNTTASSWTVGGEAAVFQAAATSGQKNSVIFSSAAENKAVTIAQNITMKGGMRVEAAGYNLILSNNATLSVGMLSATQDVAVRGAGTLSVNGNSHSSGAVKLTGTTLALNKGEINLGSIVTTNNNGQTASHVTIGTAETAAQVTLGRLEMGDIDAASQISTLTINSGSALRITGNNNNLNYKQASLVFGEWNSSLKADIRGSLLAQNAKLLIGDAGNGADSQCKVAVNVDGGTLAVKGIDGGKTEIRPRKLELSVSNNGKLILGDGGIGSFTNAQQQSAISLLDTATLGISAGTVSVAKGLVVAGAATIDTNQYTFSTDGFSVSRGNSGGTLNIANLNIASDGVLTVSGSGTVNLSGTINLRDRIDDSVAQFSKGTYGYVTGVSVSGFMSDSSTGTVAIAQDATWAVAGKTAADLGFNSVTYADGTLTMSEQSEDAPKVWFMNSGEGAQLTYTGAGDQEMTSIIINAEQDARLTLDTNGAVPERLTEIVVNNTTADIALAAGTILQGDVLSTTNGGLAHLTGRGTYAVTEWTLPAGVSLDDTAWKGVVHVSRGLTNDGRVDDRITKLAKTGSYVGLTGVNGWLGGNIAANLILTGTDENATALQISNGSSNNTRTFSGSVSGAGDIVFTWATGATVTSQIHEFSGNVSGWTGAFRTENGGGQMVGLSFSGNATEVNADVVQAGTRSLTVTYTNTAAVTMNGDISKKEGANRGALNLVAAAPVTFTGSVNADALTINNGKSAKFQAAEGKTQCVGTLSGAGALSVVGGELSVAGESTSYSGAVSVSGGQLNLNNNVTASTLSLAENGVVNIADGKRFALTSAHGHRTTSDYSGVSGNGTFAVSLESGGASNYSAITLGSSFKGTLEVTGGNLGSRSDLGAASKVTLANGSGLVFAHTSSSNNRNGFMPDVSDRSQRIDTFAKNITLADAATVTVYAWGNNDNTDDNRISGSITGAAGTTLAKSDGGTVTITGSLGAFKGGIQANDGRLILADASAERVEVALSTLAVNGGSLEISGDHYQSKALYGKIDAKYNGALTLRDGAELTVNSANDVWGFQINSGSDAGIYIKDADSSLTVTLHPNRGGETLSFKALNPSSETGARIVANHDGNGQNFSLDNSNIIISDADYAVNGGAKSVTVANKLQGTAITNTGTGLLTVTNTANTLAGVHAENGAVIVESAGNSAGTLKSIRATGADVTMKGLMAATSVSLHELVIGNNRTVTASETSSPAVPALLSDAEPQAYSEETVFADIEVTGTQEEHGTINVGLGGSTQGINLSVNATDGSVDYSADPSGVLNLHGGSLTLSTLPDSSNRILLSDKMVSQLQDNIMINVMSGIGALTVNNAEISLGSNVGDIVLVGSAASVFGTQSGSAAALAQGAQVLFRTDADGTGTLLVTPEPATATLSLLALGALAARRRRK